MKIIKVLGGLGNQMFQYAFYLYLINKGVVAKLDTSDFSSYNLHNLELNRVFGLLKSKEMASELEIHYSRDKYPLFKIRKFFSKYILKNSNILIKRGHWVEPCSSFYYSNIYLSDYVYLEGYWQNEAYFKDNFEEIRSQFQWKNIDRINEILANKLKQEESVSIHIRRMDIPRNYKQILYALRLRIQWKIVNLKYYLQAVDHIKQNVSKPVFYIFTNDIKWVKKFFPQHINFTIVDWNRNEKSYQDMFLMSHCKHNILAMSSFSWWGAWLNLNSKKIVIAPKNWGPRFEKKNKIVPKNWHTI
jgi:hypothetical protein